MYAKTTTIATAPTGNTGPGPTISAAPATRQDRLIVIDWITFHNSSGVADEVWTLFVADNNSDTVYELQQGVAGSTTDNIVLQFPTGLPITIGNGGGYSASATVGVVGGTTEGAIYVGYHFESPAQRVSGH